VPSSIEKSFILLAFFGSSVIPILFIVPPLKPNVRFCYTGRAIGKVRSALLTGGLFCANLYPRTFKWSSETWGSFTNTRKQEFFLAKDKLALTANFILETIPTSLISRDLHLRPQISTGHFSIPASIVWQELFFSKSLSCGLLYFYEKQLPYLGKAGPVAPSTSSKVVSPNITFNKPSCCIETIP